MKECLWATLLAMALAAAAACRHGPNVRQSGKNEPPLLLDEPSAAPTMTAWEGPIADNSRCHVCHLNYAAEELAVTHALVDVGCEDCHGPSDAHCGDENNVTAPEVMYTEAEINEFCVLCHHKKELTAEKHADFLAGKTPEKLCTDCHGKHRLASRTRRWDKETGRLLAADGMTATKQ